MEVPIFACLLAGLVSFLSPCVLPLVPGYISMLSGIGLEQLKDGQVARGTLFGSALAFVAGFSIVFVSFGASASAVGGFLLRNRNLLAPVAGALIILFGLHLVGWLMKLSARIGAMVGAAFVVAGIFFIYRPEILPRILKPIHFFAAAFIFIAGPYFSQWMNRDVHFRNVGGRPGLVSGFLLGFAFAFGWTPCIGPILTTVLLVASTQDSIGKGVFLLSVYSAGLAIPFLLTAVGIAQFLKFYGRFRKHIHMVEVCSGVLLLLIGGLVFVNRLTWLSGKLTFLNSLQRFM